MKTSTGEKIHNRRAALGISAIELAKRVGVSRGFIYLLEQGASGVSPEREGGGDLVPGSCRKGMRGHPVCHVPETVREQHVGFGYG